MSNFFDGLIRERQSCRDYSDKAVDIKLLYEIIEMAKNAPSACNSQPWRLFLTCTPDENTKMKNCLQDGGKNKFLDKAQAFIAVYKKDEIVLNAGTEVKFTSSHFAEYDIGEFVAYLTLAAKCKGLDSCIIGWVNSEKLNETFSLTGRCDIVVAFGYAKDATVRDKKRKELKEIIINYKRENHD